MERCMSLRIFMYSVKQTNKDLYLSKYLTKSNIMRYVWFKFKISHELLFYEIFSWIVCLSSFSFKLYANVAWNAMDGITSSGR